MLVRERMSSPVTTVSREMPVAEALTLMKEKRIRRVPVIEEDHMVGIVTDKDLLNASPNDVTAMSIWEINYILSQIKVGEVMTIEVLSVSGDTPIEEAARIMADHKVGGLPVVDNGKVVGLITETDLFRILLELLGAWKPGVRLTAIFPEKHGGLAHLTDAISEVGGSFVAFSQIAGDRPDNWEIMFKVQDIEVEQLLQIVEPLAEKIIDVRDSRDQ